MFCKDLNAYNLISIEYFCKRNISSFKNVFFNGGTKNVLAKFQKGYCLSCQISLFNGENLKICYIFFSRSRESDEHFSKNF